MRKDDYTHKISDLESDLALVTCFLKSNVRKCCYSQKGQTKSGHEQKAYWKQKKINK